VPNIFLLHYMTTHSVVIVTKLIGLLCVFVYSLKAIPQNRAASYLPNKVNMHRTGMLLSLSVMCHYHNILCLKYQQTSLLGCCFEQGNLCGRLVANLNSKNGMCQV
jgi:hypothetical protein